MHACTELRRTVGTIVTTWRGEREVFYEREKHPVNLIAREERMSLQHREEFFLRKSSDVELLRFRGFTPRIIS